MNSKYRNRLVIGITGGIASGKSATLREIARLGIPTLSSDALAHQCLESGHPCYRQVLRHFGPSILQAHKKINRKALGEIVFDNASERKWVERVIHPRVVKRLKEFVRGREGLVALDIPLLYEARLEKLADVVVVVSCSRRTQIERLKRRNGLSRADALRRIRSQWPLSEKRRRADYVLDNSRTFFDLRRGIAKIIAKLKKIKTVDNNPKECIIMTNAVGDLAQISQTKRIRIPALNRTTSYYPE